MGSPPPSPYALEREQDPSHARATSGRWWGGQPLSSAATQVLQQMINVLQSLAEGTERGGLDVNSLERLFALADADGAVDGRVLGGAPGLRVNVVHVNQ